MSYSLPLLTFQKKTQRLLTGLFALFAFVSISLGFPQQPSPVIYDPITMTVEGDQPLVYSYNISVTSPTVLPLLTTPITLQLTAVSVPAGVTTATALSYVTLTPSSLIFTGPLQTKTVTVSISVPVGTIAGDFAYRINTIGWPSGLNIVDAATFINMHTQAPVVAQPAPPVVTITTPVDSSTYTYTLGDQPLSIPLHFDAVSDTHMANYAIISIGATLNGAPITLAPPVGIGSGVAAGDAILQLSQAGTYTIVASATNAAGSATDSHQFAVNLVIPPPTVVITQPPAASYTLYAGSPPLSVPFTFEGRSLQGGIIGLSATLDGIPVTSLTASGLNTLTAIGTTSLTFTSGGQHTLVVTAANDSGTASASTSFTVNYITPTPAIVITDPLDGKVFNHTVGTPALNIPFTFTTSTPAGFKVDSVSAALDNNSITITNTVGLGTVTATSTGTLLAVSPGTHTLRASGVSAGVTVTTTVTFTIDESQPAAPTVVINTPAAGSTYSRTSTGPALSIPLTFTGTSNMTNGVITVLTATLDGTVLPVASTTLGQKVANGSATMTVLATGTHTIIVTAQDAAGTATATRTFTVTISSVKTLSGVVYLDVNYNGNRNDDDLGLGGITVNLYQSCHIVATTVTSNTGLYSFPVTSGYYEVHVCAPQGLSPTVCNERDVYVNNSDITVLDVGLGLDFCEMRCLNGDGLSQGYWKNNLSKAIAGKTKGTQETKANLLVYTSAISTLSLSPFSGLTMTTALSTMSNSDQLSLQLLAAEYNYVSGRYINHNQTFDLCFHPLGRIRE